MATCRIRKTGFLTSTYFPEIRIQDYYHKVFSKLKTTCNMRKGKIFWITLIWLSGLLMATGCGAEKAATERRNFMIPKTSEMERNSRYREVEKRKTNKIRTQKSKRKSLF